ncbi:TrlF family AAA-like ATPase [Helicobacter pylori]|uniref:TrlF family AAA-like ATPase n=1 Tax=Helicobacter pylori TaxID=210 RepID=UPI0002BBD93B|nr:AAA family ATPase [Helicobacter pylori]EMH11756.1 RecF/RecN/SMC protein [Helicobacter pylori GAM250AFi]EMH16404.1 RecF/RecN/SMC protein [Helicobacter pylori GAM250T]EMH16573.1 RecF/RecN/SMC protein [Helicobacter pylori GAM252Bi]EMH16858.1 RecF/RecN/SMC protein [Helicobacter pylori GAM252T]EMH49322.1 RecF/RecN/SMC protein [Helicobacter pylori HP250AFii]
MGNKDHSKGSSWHKWDLHVHTPYTYLNKAYQCCEEEFIQKLCDSQIDCIGLTNYFKFNEKEFDLKEKIEKKDIKVFYNLEVRLDYQNKEDQCLDFHIIFSDKVTQQEIDNFLKNADANVGGTEKKLADLEKDDFDKAVVNFDQLLECLEKESLKLRGKYLLGFLSRGHGNSRSSSNDKKITNKSHFLIHSSDSQQNLKKDREFWLEYNKPLLQSSDVHKEEQIGKKCTWIKAEKTFEGLKQIIYEPKTRVSIDENKPQDPLYKIDCVGLNFDKAVKITNEKGDTPFCYAGFNETLFFSPYFTCVIGGRGSGKSTLLQLIASAIKNKSFVKGLELETKKYIEIQPDIDIVDSVEYLAQNEVEEFATNVSKFTEAIFNRMDSKSSGRLKELEKQITKGIEKFDEQIACWQEKTKLEERLKESKNIRKKYQSIIDAFTDKNYLDKKDKLQEKRKALIDLKQSKEGFLTFIEELKRVVNFNSKENMKEKNSYDKVYNQLKQNICKELEEIDKHIKNGYFNSEDEEIRTLESECEVLRQEIGEFLKEKGVSDENIGDIRNANHHLGNIEMNIADLEREIKEKANKIEGFSYEDMDKNIKEFKNQINEELNKINSVFEEISKNHKEVKPITIEYRLNEDVFEGVFEDFDKLVDKGFNIQRHQSKIKEYLKEIELKSVIGMQHTEFTEKLDNLIENKKAAFYETMKDIFDRESHFQIYRLFVLKHLRNVEKYKIFEVRYDKRALNETSFGQRCTAVLIVLLSLGNNPIIIDEPEAHLDSALIAKYLVTLIKERKQERQIIFATHNANFVLNADAELIIQLKNENNKIIAQSFTIESDGYRDDLLKLEGGEEAFKNRERKYGITKDKN